jgi:hypothetical protein
MHLLDGRDDEIGAVYIEAPLTDEWRNLWKARLHRMEPPLPPTLLNVAMAQLNELDPIGWADWANKNMAKYLGGWFSRVELRETTKGPVLRYILYEDDVNKGYVKELNVGKQLTREEMMAALGGEMKPSPYGPIEGKPAKETKVGEKEIPPKPAKVAKPYVKRPDIQLSAETMAMEPKELLDLITLDYGLPRVYKGKNWIGGAGGLVYDEQVAILQQLYNTLVEKGVVSGPKIKVDGKYGDDTRAAVMRMQRTAGVTVDGFFGIDTKNGIYRLLGLAPEEEAPAELPGAGEGGGPEAPPEEAKETPVEAVGHVLTLTREIDRDYVKPPKGVTQLMENFYVNTDAGWLSAEKMVKANLTEIDKTWETDKDTARSIAAKENWNTATLTRKNVGVFSWANTKKVLFPYLVASGQEFEFKTWEPLSTEDGIRIPAGKVIRGRISEYNEATGEFKVEILAVQDEFTVKGGMGVEKVKGETVAELPGAGEGRGELAPAPTETAAETAGAPQTTAQMSMGSPTLRAYHEALRMVNADFEKGGKLKAESIERLKEIGFLDRDGNIVPEIQKYLLDENLDEVARLLPLNIESDVFIYNMTRRQIAKLNEACYTNEFDEETKVLLTNSLLFLGIYLAAINKEIASLPSDFTGYA